MPYMLTVERLSLMKTCIPFLEPPKTLQDAMIIARCLGFRYIWIDSLCIIHNSCRTGSDFLTTILILASSLEPYVSIPRSLPRMSPRMSRMSHRVSHRISKYLFPLPNDDVVVILFATY